MSGNSPKAANSRKNGATYTYGAEAASHRKMRERSVGRTLTAVRGRDGSGGGVPAAVGAGTVDVMDVSPRDDGGGRWGGRRARPTDRLSRAGPAPGRRRTPTHQRGPRR